MYRYILFDLDGTLTDSGEGITKSVAYAIEKMGFPAREDLVYRNRALTEMVRIDT